MKNTFLFLVAGIIFLAHNSFAQLQVTPNNNPAQLAATLAGSGVTVSGATLNCPSNAIPANNPIGTFVGTSSNIGIAGGVLLTTGDVNNAVGPNNSPSTSGDNQYVFNDPDLMAIDVQDVNDVCILEFNANPTCDTLAFTFAFGSEEYPEFVNQYNDAFGIFVTGANPSGPAYSGYNMALIPGVFPPNNSVAINNVNNGTGNGTCPPNSTNGPCTNCAYYIDNCSGTTVQYDGFTKPITVKLPVVPCSGYHFKLAIADAIDHVYDSGVFFALKSLVCATSLTVTATTTNSYCTANNGTATVTNILGGTAPYTYLWNTSPPQTTQTATGLAPGNYTVTVVDANGCLNGTTTITITAVINLPAISAGNNKTICIGSNTTLNASGGITYVWSPSTGLSNTTIANPTANPTTNTSYTVIGTDANGCTNSDTVSIAILAFPIVNAGNDVSICPGGNTTLNGTGSGTFVWSPSGNLSCSTCANPTASPTSTTTYTLTITGANACANSDTVTVFVYAPPLVDAGNSATICFGNTATLNGAGTGTFIWSPSGSLSCTTCANPIGTPTTTTTYILTVTDLNGCKNADTVNVLVNPLPVPNPGPKPGYVCPGGTDTLSAFDGIIYSWSPSASLNNANISNPVASPSVTTIYTVTVTDANGCVNKDTIKIIVAGKVPTFAGNDVSICIGQTSAILGGNPTSPNGTYYTWSPSTGLNNTTIANPTASPTITTTYIVVTANDTCSGTDTVTVFVNALPIVSAGIDATICMFDSTTLNASGGVNYVWNPQNGLSNPNIANPKTSPTSSTNYTVTVTDVNGCFSKDSVWVFVNPLPVVNAGADASMCLGDSITLNASGGINYVWNPQNGLSNPNISNPICSTTTSTNYTVTVTDNKGCVNMDSVSISIWNLPVITVSNDTSVCMGGTATLTASGGISYSWSTAATTNPIFVSPSAATTYTVIGTDVNGCKRTDSVKVFMNAMPFANFGFTISPECDAAQVQLLDSSVNANAWNWNFGDGSLSLQQNPIHAFPYSANYIITLVAINPPCSDTIKKTLTVSDLSKLVTMQPSNVFTPNNDGVNDCFNFNLNGKFEGCADLTIFDRWGIPVYHTKYSGACWDGRTTAGAILPEGTYFYIFDLKGIQLKGFITLLR